MVKMIGGFEDIGEAAAEMGQSVGNAAKKQATGFAKTAQGQITGNQASSSQNQQGINEQGNAAQQKMSDDQAKQFLKDLYGPSQPQGQGKSLPSLQNPVNQVQNQNQNSNSNTAADALGLPQSDPNKGKTSEELVQIETLRKQLHSDYYRSLTKPKPEEERVADKLEREDQEKQMEDLEKEEKKPKSLPVTVKQGTGETMVGVSG